jgi:hypothetical protein
MLVLASVLASVLVDPFANAADAARRGRVTSAVRIWMLARSLDPGGQQRREIGKPPGFGSVSGSPK